MLCLAKDVFARSSGILRTAHTPCARRSQVATFRIALAPGAYRECSSDYAACSSGHFDWRGIP
jgi:hypothetical protein